MMLCMSSLIPALGLVLLVHLTRASYLTDHERKSGGTGEKWGYVKVRENANQFWWFYGAHNDTPQTPLVLWLQGGPGASSCGFGNFEEIGEVNREMQERNTTWLKSANLLFVDHPVGSGFSYVTDEGAFATNKTQMAEDLLTVFKSFVDAMPVFQSRPFFIFTESYGGKYTSVFGVRLLEAIKHKEIKCNFKGVALGDSFISPVDFVINWGPYLSQFNLLDQRDLSAIQDVAAKSVKAAEGGEYVKANELNEFVQQLIDSATDSVNVYNVLQHHTKPDKLSNGRSSNMPYPSNIGIYQSDSLADFMNGPIRQKLEIIPESVKWGGQSADVYKHLVGDIMRNVIKEVDVLLENEISVTIYQGQLDMICGTSGAEAWMPKLKWKYINDFLNSERMAIYTDGKPGETQAFYKKYRNLHMFYIMNAGHMVPSDNAEMALKMLNMLIGTP